MSTVPNRQHAVNRRRAGSGRTAAGDAFSALVIRVFRLAGLFAAEGDAIAAAASGQTTARWQVLAAVEDEARSVAQVARLLGLARQSVQRVADALETAGLVAFEANPRHRRAKLVALTDAGRTALAAIQEAQRPWADALGGAVGEADLVRANALLDRVLAAVAARREEEGDNRVG